MDRQFRNECIERDDDDDERKDNTPEIGCRNLGCAADDPDVGSPVNARGLSSVGK